MNDFYTTQHICKTFSVSHQTVKNWCDEFGEYLSPTAKPGDGKKRLFTDDDLRVFALIFDYHKRGLRYEDAHISLKSGQLGEMPETTLELIPSAPPGFLVTLREEIHNLREKLKTTETERDEERGQNRLLKQLLDEKEQLLQRQYEEKAELRAELKTYQRGDKAPPENE